MRRKGGGLLAGVASFARDPWWSIAQRPSKSRRIYPPACCRLSCPPHLARDASHYHHAIPGLNIAVHHVSFPAIASAILVLSLTPGGLLHSPRDVHLRPERRSWPGTIRARIKINLLLSNPVSEAGARLSSNCNITLIPAKL